MARACERWDCINAGQRESATESRFESCTSLLTSQASRRTPPKWLDRQAFIDIIGEGQGEIGATMQPPPNGVWGMPAEMLRSLPGYDPDVAKNRAQAQDIMKKLGYGPDKRLPVTVTTRNVAAYRDPAVILIDQLKEIYIDGTLNAIDTTQWYPTVMRKVYAPAFTVTATW